LQQQVAWRPLWQLLTALTMGTTTTQQLGTTMARRVRLPPVSRRG